ncbi:hypothetical protein SCALM49S_07918 [Streptomyces californicus]
MSATFQTASTFCLPVLSPKSTWWVTVAPGCAPPSSNSAIFSPPTKYCQVLVA